MHREGTILTRLSRWAIVVVRWLVSLILLFTASVWVISPLLWKQVSWGDIYVVMGRSMTLSLLWVVGCSLFCTLCTPRLSVDSLRQLRWSHLIALAELIWKFSGVCFAILFPSACLLLGYWILTKP